MTAARPGQFTGATDNPASGGLFTDTLIDGIPDLVGADVLAAQTAATNAATSETNAANSETAAATSETNAATSATNAATSATNAATSAASAAADVASIGTSVSDAAASATAAATSATNAATSETAAAGSATSASSSATSATSSANTAVTSASAAGTSATNAATSETNSANSAAASATSATASANSATASATSATAAQTAQTAAELAETNAETAETNAETAETGAATSATNAANSASAASTSETNAATSATNAANSATASATSATNSANSATAAAASEAAAAGYVDNFDDKYLGAKASDPTVDNDGDPLTDGALYYNTTDNRMKVYDLGTTTWLFLAPTNAEQTNINTVANDITNVNTVATNITDVNSFADTYFISATAPASPTTGDLWFDTANSIMKVYDGSGFVNAGSSVNGTSARYNYTATAGQTTFAAVYDTGYVDVYLNGVKLAPADFTATNGSSIVLTSGAALNDTVDIVGYGTFSVASAVTLPDNVKATFGDSADLQIYHDGTDSVIKDTGTGNLVLTSNGGGIFLRNNEETETYANFNNNGSVQLRYDNSAKFETTATGVDVTGTVTADDLTLSDASPTIQLIDTDGTNTQGAILQAGGSLLYRSRGGTTTYGGHIFARNNGADTNVLRTFDSGDISFYADDGTTQGLFWDASAQRLGLGTTAVSDIFTVKGSGVNQILTSLQADGTSSESRIELIGTNSTSGVSQQVHIGAYQPSGGATTDAALDFRVRKDGDSFDSPTTIMTLTDGNVGIGTNLPAQLLHLNSSGNVAAAQIQGASHTAKISTDGAGTIFGTTTNGYMLLTTNDAERMRIDTSGNLLVGRTNVFASTATSGGGSVLNADGLIEATKNGAVAMFNRNTTTGRNVEFRQDGTIVGDVSVTGSGTTYNTTSDLRLKTDIEPIDHATDMLMAMNPVLHRWKADPDADAVVGFIAQEMQEIVPEAVSGSADSDEMMAMDYGRITPVLVAALQDAHKKIKQLEQRIADMENK